MNATMDMKAPEETALDERFSIPLDLAEWAPSSQLAQWIMDDVATLNWTDPEVMELLRRRPDFEPKAWLNTMTLAFATGVFTSDEIARRCSTDAAFRAVRPKLPPVASELRAFRRENRGLFKWTLAKVLTHAVKAQFVEGDAIEVLPSGLRRAVVENAIERLDLARHLDRKSGEL